ncbi:MAG: hypothetical protein ABJL18_01085, partial [Hyphomicrobiales bacterium]
LKLNGRTDARIMGCLAPLQMPYWAGMEPIKQLQLSSLRMIMPHQHKVEIARPVQADIEAEEQSMKFAGSRKVGHLTVLDGGVH